MLIFWTLVIGAILGYVFGYYIKPNQRLRKAIKEARETCAAVLEESSKGVYKTIVTDHNQSSELVVEVKELAVTKSGQVKVQYLDAFYKNPEFRTKKGEALLKEMRELLGDYLPLSDIEWYETKERHDNIRKHLSSLDNMHQQHSGK
ncbi:YhcB family protein [Pontibacter vulgaris]|uniref:YhcB family protein n=1 Tax=Pontibacter vulgaris TaxID=2905679 RepID=UPI001FA6C6D9|nr:YhcB family protein [Pontibacter vulgaris]